MGVFECGKQDAGEVIRDIKQFIERLRNMPPTYARSCAANKQESPVA